MASLTALIGFDEVWVGGKLRGEMDHIRMFIGQGFHSGTHGPRLIYPQRGEQQGGADLALPAEPGIVVWKQPGTEEAAEKIKLLLDILRKDDRPDPASSEQKSECQTSKYQWKASASTMALKEITFPLSDNKLLLFEPGTFSILY